MKHDVELKLQAWLDGELPEGEAAEVAALAARDPQAQALINELKCSRLALAGNEPERRLPESREFYWSKIEREIRLQQAASETAVPVSTPVFAWLRRSLVPLGGVAALALVLFVSITNSARLGPSLSAPVSHLSELEVASDALGAVTYRSYSENLTVVWFYNRNDSSFTEPGGAGNFLP